jgi:hypothetical protein
LNPNKDTVWVTRTDNIGKAELWANMFGDNYNKKDKFSVSSTYQGNTFTIKNAKRFNKGINQLTVERLCSVPDAVDAVFVVDATGSMGDEISYLKEELNDVIKRVKENHSDFSLRLGSVFYRDKGDAYVTRKSELSDDVNKTIDFIKQQSSGGGGDFPEAVDEALDSAINGLNWSENARARILFLVLDAPPHSTPENLDRMQKLTSKAAAMGIKIVPVTGSGIDKSTEYLMRSMALCTNGTYTFLTDDSKVGNPHIKPTTDKWEVEKLNDLLVRLFNQFTSVVTCEKEFPIDMQKEISDTAKIEVYLKSDNDTLSLDSNAVKPPLKKEFYCKFYPNPTSGILNVEITGNVKELFMTDISGKIIERFSINRRKSFRIDISRYPRGIYLMTYYGENNRPVSGKIMKNQ